MGHTFSIQPVFVVARALAVECLKKRVVVAGHDSPRKVP